MNEPNILTESWPDDAAKAEVEAFARDLQNKLPALPSEAMQRIGGAMHDEMALQRWRKRRLRLAATATVAAASLLIGVGIVRVLDSSRSQKPHSPDTSAVLAVPTVRDEYRVPVMTAPLPPTVDPLSLLPVDEQKKIVRPALPKNDNRPLVAIESNRSLFIDE